MIQTNINILPPIQYLASQIAKDDALNKIVTNIESSDKAISIRLPILGSGVALRIVRSLDRYLIGAYGISAEATQWINEVLVVQGHVESTIDGRFFLKIHEAKNPEEALDRTIDAANLLMYLRFQDEADQYPDEQTTAMYWASETFNFGDWIGPQLIHQLTGRQPVHMRRLRKNRRVLFSVGSILGVMRRNNVDIWGSGLIKPLTQNEIDVKRKLSGIKVHAVRGKLTQDHLIKNLGWDVPDVYGDPALLIPDYLPSTGVTATEVSCVPHYVHREQLIAGNPEAAIVDVRMEVANVVRQIQESKAVISSSLHGLIIAQAYDIPWVRLDVVDKPLTGGDFKFEDFYSCLDRSTVSSISVRQEDLTTLNLTELAREASLPRLEVDLTKLRNSLPVKVCKKPVDTNIFPSN
ncbi:polysaccharide pyruvyl transferase family protein [Glutamicibacter arilaitensis]|uniref:polysaccharide pyruvyl transferase family protein n=1 Tax=Glutamicibacter arilaitensis TaxID=256701 RepID=UPI003FD63268